MNPYDYLTSKIQDSVNVLLDKKVRIGVTGLSRGGKTALLTSLINNIHTFGSPKAQYNLPRFKPLNSDNIEILYGGFAKERDLELPQFPYHEALTSLSQEDPVWPKPTDSISKAELEIRYKENSFFGSSTKTLYLEIWDYPGEWLMDLMLLDMDYFEFSKLYEKRLASIGNVINPSNWLKEGTRFNLNSKSFDELTLKNTVTLFKEWLKKVKEYGFAMALPGRFVLPGALEGSLMLEFVPWVWPLEEAQKDSETIKELVKRYETYKEKVVKKFYEDCFSKIDRQIVLVDCIEALMGGKETFMDINESFEVLLKHFNYGSNNFFTRLFFPKIEKTLFVATKADNVTNNEHGHLLELLNSMVGRAATQVRAEGALYETMVLSAIKATKCVEIYHDNEEVQVLTTPYAGESAYFPGTVPTKWSKESMEFFQANFKRMKLNPPRLSFEEPLPQMNLDLLLKFMLEDKF